MFTITTSLSALPFIRHADIGMVTACHALRFCLVEFDERCYQNDAFSHFRLPFPASLVSAVTKRRAEYLAGRYAAQRLLLASGCHENVLTGPDRAPLWPTGWRGSLSHTSRWAIAVVGPVSAGLAPGVDIECHAPDMMCESADLFVTPVEQARLANCGMATETALLIAFSAKESLYKALYPQVQRFFGFEAAEICCLDPHHRTFTLRLTQALSPSLPVGYRLSGYYHMKDDYIITLVF